MAGKSGAPMNNKGIGTKMPKGKPPTGMKKEKTGKKP